MIFQFSVFGTDEIYANMEYIMQITRDNYSQYAQMVQQMFGKKASSNDPLAQCDYGNFSLRFKPVDINFTKPNWDTIMTKRDKPAMSDEEFARARVFTSIYNDELARLKEEYGEKAKGNVSYSKIKADISAEESKEKNNNEGNTIDLQI